MKATLEQLFARTCAQGRRMVHPFSNVEKLGDHLSNVWTRSQALTHPYVQLERGFVFIHIPKTAGTSLSDAFGLNAPLNSNLHKRARDILPFLKKISPNVKSIAFTRDPFARFVSLYNFARAAESLYHSTSKTRKAPYGKHLDHDTLLGKDLEACAELLVQGKLGCANFPSSWSPQVEWLIDDKGNLIVDFIGRVESLNSDLERLEQIHGIATAKTLPWLNKSSGNDGEIPVWTERARDLVRLYYKRDFEMLGYDDKSSSNLCSMSPQKDDSAVRTVPHGQNGFAVPTAGGKITEFPRPAYAVPAEYSAIS